MPRDLTLAFAGHAPNTKRNIELLLTDWLRLGSPDAEGYYTKPDRYSQITIYVLLADGEVPAGLKPALTLATKFRPEDATLHLVTDEVTDTVADWSECVDHVHEAGDPFEFLIGALTDRPSSYLLINWDEGDPDDEQLIKLAHQAGKIKVVDLVQGLAEIQPDEEEATPEPEPEQPTETGRKSRHDVVEELEPEEEELPDEPASPTSTPRKTAEEPQVDATSTLEEDMAAAHREMQTTIAVGEVTVPADFLRALAVALSHAAAYTMAEDTKSATRNLATTECSPLTAVLNEQVQALNLLLYPELDYQRTPALKPAKKPSGKPTKVIWDEDAGEWKKAGRGRVRAGTRVGYMGEDGNVTEGA